MNGLLVIAIVVAGQCETGTLVAADGASGDDHGAAVAIDGDVIVVGAPEDDDDGSSSGAAYVYRNGDGGWTSQQKLTALDADSFDDFGAAVDVDGDTIIVGAPRDDDAGRSSGSAYVFTFNGATWSQQQKLVAADATAGDQFGFSVAIHGDTALVGAINHDEGAANAGVGYVFTRRGSTWTQQDELLADDPAGSAQLGHAAALDGEIAVLGAWQDAPDGQFLVGAAYVFRRRGETWAQDQKLTASDATDFRWFGTSVAISGSTVAVGAYGDQADGLGESGGVYVYQHDGDAWSGEVNLHAPDAAADARFGWTVAIDGDELVVGTGLSADDAYAFSRDGGSWTFLGHLDTDHPDASGEYGYSAAVAAGTAVIGDRGGFRGAGAAFLFDLAGVIGVADLIEVIVNWGCLGPCPGDANGDGVVDVSDLVHVVTEWGSCG